MSRDVTGLLIALLCCAVVEVVARQGVVQRFVERSRAVEAVGEHIRRESGNTK